MSNTPHGNRSSRLLDREAGGVRKPHAGRLRVALAFPNSYHVGMSNLGFQTAYRLFNEPDEVVCERVFLPSASDAQAVPPRPGALATAESGTPVRDFDVFAFSVSFEWDYVNVVRLLRHAGLPVYASERDARHPLVVLGGAVTFLNPEPLAPFADVVAVGEGEALVPALVRALAAGAGRDAVLRALASEPGFYVPSLIDVRYAADGTIAAFEPRPGSGATVPVRKASLPASACSDPPATAIFTPDTEFGSRLLVEAVRGCPNLCRFCWAGYNYLPVRAFPADRILEIARASRPHASRIGLVSIALCDHPEIERLLAGLVALGYTISPASLRLDDLTEPVLRLLREGGERSITIAPEAGSDRLRRVINKGFSNADILDRADMIFSAGFESLKLYFMIGLPTEADEDLAAIRDLTLALKDRMLAHARAKGRIGHISASVNPLVPKPGTAYQWLPMARPDAIDRTIRRLRTLTAGIPNVTFSIKSERQAFHQALLSLGDRRVAPVIDAAERNGGQWRHALAETGVDAAFYVYRDRSNDEVLPWDVIDDGTKAAFFRAELAKSFRAEPTQPRATAAERGPRPSGDPGAHS